MPNLASLRVPERKQKDAPIFPLCDITFLEIVSCWKHALVPRHQAEMEKRQAIASMAIKGYFSDEGVSGKR